MKKIWTYWLISLLLAIACVVVNYSAFRVKDIIKLEFAPSAGYMHTYIMSGAAPTEDAYHTLMLNTIVDFIFIIAYSLLTLFSFKILLDLFQISGGLWIYVLAFIPGIFDCVENVFLVLTAARHQEVFSRLYYYAVRIKWGFAIVPYLLILIIMIYGLVILFRTRQSFE